MESYQSAKKTSKDKLNPIWAYLMLWKKNDKRWFASLPSQNGQQQKNKGLFIAQIIVLVIWHLFCREWRKTFISTQIDVFM